MNTFLRRLIGPEAALIAVFLALSSMLYLGARHFNNIIETNGTVVQVAGRMRLEINSLYRWLAEAENRVARQRSEAIEQLGRTAGKVDQLLGSIVSGGAAEIAPRMVLNVPPGAVPESARGALNQLRDTWQPIGSQIAAMVDLEGSDRILALSDLLIDARLVESELIGQSSRLLGVISVNSFNVASRQQMLQIVGAALGIGFFFLLIWLYSRQLKRFRAAKRETDEILQTVTSGLFLINRDLRLGDQYSTQLEYILQRKQLAGTDFLQMLSEMVPAETLGTVRDYLDLLFSERVEETLIGSLNPLDRVQVRLPSDSGRVEQRFLEFSFRRVFDDHRLLHLLVSVNDVTDRVHLTAEIEALKEKQDQQTERMLELLVSLFKLEPEMLDDTLERWHDLMQQANEALKQSNSRKGDLRPLIDEVFRPMHTVKSEAAGLRLDFLSQRAAAVEEAIARLRELDPLTGNDFLAATVRLEELFAQFSVVRRIIERLHEQGVVRVEPPGQKTGDATGQPLVTMLQRLVRQLNDDLGIQADLRIQGLNEDTLPERLREPLRDILVQLVRNACAHGIEPARLRQESGKGVPAILDVRLNQDPDHRFYELVFRDDGRGIDFDAIGKRAVEMGLVTANRLAGLDRNQLMRLMFHPGLSTAREMRDDAGQGVGMDIVREAINRLDASIQIGTRSGRHTTFKLRIPA